MARKPAGGPPPAKPLPTGWKIWVAGARPRTLPAAIVAVLVGTAAAAGTNVVGIGELSPDLSKVVVHLAPDLIGSFKGILVLRMLAALVVSLAIQVATNFANDYSDGKRGTDDPGKRVGPPRLVGWGLASPAAVKRAVVLSFAIAAMAGLYLAATVGWWLILVGLVCFAAGWFYTGGPKPYGYAGFGELFVFVFFGLVATVGSAYVQHPFGTDVIVQLPVQGAPRIEGLPQTVTAFPFVTFGVAVAIGCLATALLVINNLRDIPSDTQSGKRTLAVKLGDKRTRILYVVLIVLPFLIIPVVCGLGGRPLGAMALFAIVFANQPVLQVLQGAKGPALIPVLGQTGRLQLVFGVLLSIGLFLSA